ncbi:hypothetical protein [Chryseobacterium sp. C3]|uniref:hypothetical protein n=1 Tax=Chryseobacterium sp. C3 TaxID=2761532 RepID=UPI0016235646|nr:hypothetical protein [Chryseobacterium sp. C3]
MKKSYFIMLMALAFLLQGCRSGDLAEMQDNPTETQHSSKNYASLDKFLQVTGIRKDDLYKDVSFSKGTSSAEEFEVNTDKILETIKNQQVTAFSFIVYPKNGSTVEQQNNKDVFYNMAYLKKGNHWEKYILKYTVEKGWLSSLDTQPNKPFNGSIAMVYPNAAASKTYVCGFSAVPVFYCWAGHTDPNDDDCGSCWHWNTTSILCDDGSTANPNPDDGTATGGASGFETNLPTEEYEAMMVQKFASFINNFNLNSYGFSTELKSKLFHFYLSLQEDDYIISQLLSASPTNSPQKANLLNWAIDYFNANLSTMPVDELTTSTKSFLTWGSNFFIQNPTTTWQQFEYLIYNKTIYETSLGDDDNNITGGYDTTIYDNFDPLQQNWPTIPSIIPIGSFIGWGYPGIKRNCMDYAKAQIAIKGFQISNYGAPGQTYQIYREQTGVNQSNLIAGLSYLKYALSNNIPVIVGVHDAPGHPGNADQTTDHFIVIVGMGSDNSGKYFTFYDNASGSASLGANPNNKLYYNQATGIISGTSATPYANGLIYILTQIRKSKLK